MSKSDMLCPACGVPLEATRVRRGIVWLCRSCWAGAATLPILRRVAPRAFVNQVWQAALHDGRPSASQCPSCTQPFTTFSGSAAQVEPSLEVCTRCNWVWLSSAGLASLSQLRDRPALLQRAETANEADAPVELELSDQQARELLQWLAGSTILSLLPPRS